MRSLEAVRAAKDAVRAKLSAEGFEVVSIGIYDGEDERALSVGVVKCIGPTRRVRRIIGGVNVIIYEDETQRMQTRKPRARRGD